MLKDGKGKFTMPDDARGLIEGVYSHEAEDTIPEILLDASMDADGKNMMQQSMANLNALKLTKATPDPAAIGMKKPVSQHD